VTPRPFRRPRPPLFLTGWSRSAARRAARIADGFEPTLSEFEEAYLEECERIGKTPFLPLRASLSALFSHLSEKPDETWNPIAPHALHESNSYARWISEANPGAPFTPVEYAKVLRSSGICLVLTPEELVERAMNLGPADVLQLHPLMGGLDPSLACESLELFEREVLPRLRAG
jgi:alkanesulfonate monooxygenase SsuD/methylene tetrahydromethanopterin reductase-like flavin-dependent oxidoreductase (luciferase family)